jgi:hypothetical protein
MLEQINDLPPHVVGIRATGEVTKEDMETVLLPKVKELVDREGKINYLLVLETGVQNFTLAAWWDDMKLGIANFTNWHRIAVVSDQKGVEWFTDMFRFFVPGTAKGFTLNELEEAKFWVAAEEEEDIELLKNANKEQGPQGENL